MTARVLVTGATGFIGREIVRRLLPGRYPVTLLVRARGEASVRERVRAVLDGGIGADRLEVIEGDLSRSACGVDEAGWRRLRETVESVIHCAADATFVAEATAEYAAAHVGGPVDLLRRLAPGRGRLRRWAQLSTAYVCGTREGAILERDGDVGQTFHNAYERVKLDAELALRAASAAAGVDVRIFRPSIVVGAAPATAGGTPANLFFAFIRLAAGLAALGGGRPVPLRIAAASKARFNLVPVEYVARALLTLATTPAGAGGTFHLVVAEAPTQATVLAAITARLGIDGPTLVEELVRPTALERTVARMLAPYHPYLAQRVSFDDREARRLLEAVGVARPTLGPDDVHRLIDLALTSDGLGARPYPAPAG